MKNAVKLQDWLFPALLCIVWAFAFHYVYDSKLDLNGDNCVYYMNATSIATGHGYSDISTPEYKAVNNFPPGYPLLMAGVRFFTESVQAQKCLNGLFLLGGVLLLYFTMRRAKFEKSMAFVAGCAMILCERVLHFATIMMSEMSFFFFTALAFYALYRAFPPNEEEEKNIKSTSVEIPFWKNRWYWIAIFALVFCYHIRTQGIALVAGVLLFLLCTKRWKETLSTAGLFVVGCLPWMLRNKMMGMEQSRYFESISQANPWRPEDGSLDLSGIIDRFFDTLGMLVSKAIPNSIAPYVNLEYNEPASMGLWLLALLLIALIGFGFWQFGKFRWLLLGYIVATLGVISIFSTPSENRYIVTILPFLNMGLLVGLCALLMKLGKNIGLPAKMWPWILTPLLFTGKSNLQLLHKINEADYPPNYRNFFNIGQLVKINLPPNTVVVSRKPAMFYMFSGTSVAGYKYSSDDKEVIRELIKSNAGYVILDQLGYSSTPMYLLPAIQKNMELFSIVHQEVEPDTYLLKFDIEKAKQKLGIQ